MPRKTDDPDPKDARRIKKRVNDLRKMQFEIYEKLQETEALEAEQVRLRSELQPTGMRGPSGSSSARSGMSPRKSKSRELRRSAFFFYASERKTTKK